MRPLHLWSQGFKFFIFGIWPFFIIIIHLFLCITVYYASQGWSYFRVLRWNPTARKCNHCKGILTTEIIQTCWSKHFKSRMILKPVEKLFLSGRSHACNHPSSRSLNYCYSFFRCRFWLWRVWCRVVIPWNRS